LRYIANSAAPAIKSTSVPGSGTAAAAEFITGEPADEGSKMNVPPAPAINVVPEGKAFEFVTTNVPALTNVPPA